MPPISRRTFLKNAGATTALYNPETMIRAATNPAGAVSNLQPMGVIRGIIDDLHHNPFQSGLPLSTGSWLGELDAGGGDEIGFWDSWEAAKNELTPREISDIKSGKRESQLYKALNQIVSGMRNGTPEGVQFRYFLLHQAESRKSPVDYDLQKRIQDAAIEHYNKVGSQSRSEMYVEDPVVWLELEHDGRWELNSQYKVLYDSFERIPGLNNALEHLSSQPLNVLKGFIKDGGIREMAKVFSQIPVSAAATVDGFSEFKKTDSYKNNMPEKSRPQDLSQEALQKFSSPARPQSILPMDTGFPMEASSVLGEQTGPRINPMGAVGPEPRMSAEVHSSKGDLNYLSNFADVQGGFEFNGRRYRTVEGAYQSLKSGQYVPGFEGLTGSQAKSKGRSVRVDRATNEKLMMDLLSARAQQDPAFRDMLSSTGQQKLTHTVGDKFWAQKFPEILEQVRGAVGPSDLTSNLPMDPEQLIRNQQAAEMGKQLFANPQYAIDKVPVPMSPQERAIREAMKGSALSAKEFYGGYPNKQALIEGIKRAASQGVDVAELLPLIPAGVLSQQDHEDLMKSRWEENPRTGGLTSKAIDPGIELAIEAVGAPGVPTEYGNQLPFSSYGITTGQPVGPGKSSEILSASQLKRIGGMETLEQQLEALRDIVYDRGIQAHNEIKQNALNYMENTAGTPAGTKTIAGKIRDAQAGGKFSGATSEDLINQMATGIADQAITGVSQRAGKYEPAVVEGATTFEDPDRVLMRALVNSDIPFEQDPDAASASEGYKVDTEAAFIENMGDEKRFDPTVNTRPIEQLSPGERLAASLQGATGIPPLSESEIMKLANEINRVKTATVQSFADQPELLLAQGRQQQMVWNPKTEKYETTIDYTGKKKSAHSPLDYLNMWSEGARGKLDLPYDPRDGGIRRLINIVRQLPASPQAMPPMDIGLGSNAGAVLGEQTGPRINPDYQQQFDFGDPAPQDFGNDGWKFHLNATRENIPKIYQILDRHGLRFKGPGAAELSKDAGYDFRGDVKDLLNPSWPLPSKPITVYGYKDSGLFGRDQMMDLVNKLEPEIAPLLEAPDAEMKGDDLPIRGNIYGRFDPTSRSEPVSLQNLQKAIENNDTEWIKNSFQRYGTPGFPLLSREANQIIGRTPEQFAEQRQRAFDRLSELYGEHFLGTGENKFTPEWLAKNPEAEDLIRQIVDADRTATEPSFDAEDLRQTFDVNQDKSFDLTGTSPTDLPVMQALPVAGPPAPMEALPVTNNAKLKQKLKDPVGTMKGAGEWAIDKAKNNIITRTGGKVNNFFDLPADSPLRMKIDEMAGDSKLKQGLGRSVRFGASLPGAAGRMGMPKAIGLDSLADIVELSKGAYKINQYERFGTPKDLVIGRDVQNYDELIAHLVGRNTDAHDGNGVAYITPDQAERLIGLKNELTSAYQRGEIKEAEEHPNYKTMRKLINEFTKNREDGPQGAFNRSINVLEPSSSDEMGWMSQWRKEVQAGQDNFIDEPEAQLTPYGMFHVPIWSDVTGRAGSVEGAAGLGGGALDHITNPYAFIPRVAEGVLGDNSSSYASLGDGFVRSPNYETIRLRSDVDTKSLLGEPNEEKQKIIYDGTPYTNTRYWKWNPDSRTLVNRHTGTSVREEDTGIQNFGEKMRNWNEYTRRMRDAQSRGEGEGTFSGEGVQSKVDAIESDFKGRAMFDKYDHGHTARHAHEGFGISDIWEEGSVFEDLPWYSKIGVALDRATDASEKMHSDAWEGVKGWFGTGQSDETEDPRRMDNIIRIYRKTGDNPAHIVGYNRDMANPGWSENPYGRFATEQERLLRNLIPYWEHKESKYSDIYKLIGEGE